MSEEYWAARFPPGRMSNVAFYYFELDFQDVPDNVVARVRELAERLGRDAHPSRSVVHTTSKYIAHLCTVRLNNPLGSPANYWVVRVAWNPQDDEDAARGDVASITTWAREIADSDPDNAVGSIWGEIAEAFQRGPHRPTARDAA